jgi:hypothetical protein
MSNWTKIRCIVLILRYSGTMQTTETRGLTFRLPAGLLEKFKGAAASSNRSVSGELRNLMEQRVAEHEADRDSEKTGAVA